MRGFTIIEILFAVAIIAIALSIVSFSFFKLNSRQTLDKSAELVAAVLNEARSQTLSSLEGSQYGVNLGESQVVLFKGASFSPEDLENVATELNQLVGIRDVSLLGGGTSVVFKRLSGNTDQYGTLEIFLKSDPDQYRAITIRATGIVELD